MSDSVRPHRRQPTRFPRPGDSPGKNTGVGCHFLLQCIKVKSESEVTQLCLTLHDLMDCSPPGSSVHGIFQAKVLEWGDIAFSVSFSLGPGNTSNWPFVDSLETSLRASWLSIFWSLFCASYLSGCLLPLQLLVFQWQLPADAPCCRQWLFYAGNFVVKTCLVSPFCTVWCTAG